MTDPRPLTQAFSPENGEPLDVQAVLPELYEELRGIASGYLRQERSDHTLQPTALVHEAYLKLIDQTRLPWSSASHFRAIAARAMRQVLVDHARKTGALKRGGGRLRVTLGSAVAISDDNLIDVLELDDALAKLAALNERKATIVELLFFGGLTHDEASKYLGISKKTVEADWYMARAWLGAHLTTDER